jgi:tyrosyl-tRNA synthetase
MWRYFELLSFRPLKEIEQFKRDVAEGANPRDIKFLLGQEVVARFHGAAAGRAAQDDFIARFQKGALPEDMPELDIEVGSEGIGVVELLKQCNLVASGSEANRLLEQGGVKVDGEKAEDRSLKLKAGSVYVLQVGKRKFARVTLKAG